MGILNVTPDSFSDGGRYVDLESAIDHGHRMVKDGAGIIDVGGESTRPGARPVSVDEELARVIPVLEAFRDLRVPVSVDTRRPQVMRAALDAGASMINDVQALEQAGALDAVAEGDCAVCLMHMKGNPSDMQSAPYYDDVVGEVRDFLAARVAAAVRAGIARERLLIDPGFGFGKNAAHNLELLRRLPELVSLGLPVLAGWSRKSTLGEITGHPPAGRVAASIAAALLALVGGARVLRVHDVRETQDAVLVWEAWSRA